MPFALFDLRQFLGLVCNDRTVLSKVLRQDLSDLFLTNRLEFCATKRKAKEEKCQLPHRIKAIYCQHDVPADSAFHLLAAAGLIGFPLGSCLLSYSSICCTYNKRTHHSTPFMTVQLYMNCLVFFCAGDLPINHHLICQCALVCLFSGYYLILLHISCCFSVLDLAS